MITILLIYKFYGFIQILLFFYLLSLVLSYILILQIKVQVKLQTNKTVYLYWLISEYIDYCNSQKLATSDIAVTEGDNILREKLEFQFP